MQVDFYQLSRDPVEQVVPLLARGTLDRGERLLVISADAGQRARIGGALWDRAGTFLANGAAGTPHEERQPILVGEGTFAANGARYLVLADGCWREDALRFARVFLLFDGSTIDGARALWRGLSGHQGMERNYWMQEAGRWIKAA